MPLYAVPNPSGMASAVAGVEAMRYRRPWYLLVLLGLAALAATAFVVWNARSRIVLNTNQFTAMQTLRLEHMERRIDEYFLEAKRTTALGSRILGTIHGNRALLRQLTIELFRSDHDPALYGLGIFYEPFAFDSHTELLNDYVHSGSRRYTPFDRFLPGGVDEVFLVIKRSDAEYNYLNDVWYRGAVAAHGKIDIIGPYDETGRSFISTVQAFYQNGRLAGMMSVDTLTTMFKAMMVSALSNGDIAWIEGRKGEWLLGTSRLPRDASSRIDRSMPLYDAGARVHLSSDASQLIASNRRSVYVATGAIAIVWIMAAMISRLLLSRWRARERTLALELRQARLEAEIALGRTVAAELHKAAYIDALTGLPNRAAFLERAAALLTGDDASHAILFIDLDRFNIINETLGHLAGDELIRVVAIRLSEAPGHDMVARLGADEFAIVTRTGLSGAREVAARALAIISEPVVLLGRNVHPRASIGVVPIDAAYEKPHDLLRDAETAVHEAKARGRGGFVLFDAAMRRKVAEDSALETSLRHAIEHRELEPFYQPIVSIQSRAISSFEALVRWHRPGHGTVSAFQFMPFAQAHAIEHEIDALVLPQIAHDCGALFAEFPDATVAVNLSAAELADRDLSKRIETLLAKNAVPPTRLKLEITETTMMTASEEASANLKHLRSLGIQLVLDDFGTGYSSLAYLQRLPVVGLKIDRSFVEHIAHDERNAELVRNIVALAHTFSLYTVAEGVENMEQLELLASIGVGFAQGYLFSPAVDIAAIAGLAASTSAGSARRV